MAQSKASQLKQLLNIRILEECETARRLEVTLRDKKIQTPNYILTTNGGALNGVFKHNLSKVNFEMVSLNFPDMHEYKSTLIKYKEHLAKEQKDNHLKRYFNYEDKLVFLTPFSYSADKEKVGGFNDDVHYLLNGKHKVNVQDYFDLAIVNQPDLVVNPCEQVTPTSGKKKRRRSIKASLKNLEKFQKLMKEQPEAQQSPIIASVYIGDDQGLESFEMRQFLNRLIHHNQEESAEFIPYEGVMIYGTDGLDKPSAFQEVKDFLVNIPKNKLLMHHSDGSPVEILNGIMAGMDLFESDYPLKLAEQGIAVLIHDIDIREYAKTTSAKTFLNLSKALNGKRQKTLELSKEENKRDEQPLVKGCGCYACKNYTRSYFYHLLEVKEMNANILLAIHNTWQYNRFFEKLQVTSIQYLPQFIEAYLQMNCD